MDAITLLIKDEIKRQYKNPKKFSEATGIPYSTLVNALTKGVGGTAYSTVTKICQILGLKQVFDSDITIFNEEFQNVCRMLERLDDHGVQTVKAVLMLEYNRCINDHPDGTYRGFNGLLRASDKNLGSSLKRFMNNAK